MTKLSIFSSILIALVAVACSNKTGEDISDDRADQIGPDAGLLPGFTVHVVSANINKFDENGESWDSDGLPDTYVVGSLATDLVRDWSTEIIESNLSPMWENVGHGVYLFHMLYGEGFVLEVRDRDALGVYETVGSCTLDIMNNDDFLNGEKHTVGPCGQVEELTFFFRQL